MKIRRNKNGTVTIPSAAYDYLVMGLELIATKGTKTFTPHKTAESALVFAGLWKADTLISPQPTIQDRTNESP